MKIIKFNDQPDQQTTLNTYDYLVRNEREIYIYIRKIGNSD